MPLSGQSRRDTNNEIWRLKEGSTTLSPVIAERPAKRVALVFMGDIDAAHHKVMKRDVGDLEKSA